MEHGRIAAVRHRCHFAEDGLNKDTAKRTANDMAFLADDMLRQSGAGQWRLDLRRLEKKILISDRELKVSPQASRSSRQSAGRMNNPRP